MGERVGKNYLNPLTPSGLPGPTAARAPNRLGWPSPQENKACTLFGASVSLWCSLTPASFTMPALCVSCQSWVGTVSEIVQNAADNPEMQLRRNVVAHCTDEETEVQAEKDFPISSISSGESSVVDRWPSSLPTTTRAESAKTLQHLTLCPATYLTCIGQKRASSFQT